ncbi:MAG TPA: PAS domain-containing protein [Solirubrobacteraceae bacterium]|nr:PAS domain-containing protein [Solirubrobacteraceae bacterium]
MPEAHVGMDAQGVVTEWDQGAEMLFGYTRDQALARTVAELIVPSELRRVHTRGLRRVAGGGPSVLAGKRVEVPALDAYGRQLLVELTISEVDDPPTRFLGTIGVVGAHGATDRPVSADR